MSRFIDNRNPGTNLHTLSLDTPLPPGSGGLGSSTAPTNGQVPIGSTATGKYAPANITGTAGQVTVTNGAGSVTLSVPSPFTPNVLQPSTKLQVPYGGTGLGGINAGEVVVGTGTNTMGVVTANAGTVNYFSETSSVPSWKTPTQVKTDLSLDNVENTALTTWVGSTNITTLGTVATGTWNATAIGPTKGGTNQTTYTTGDTLYSSASNTLSKLAGNTTATVNYYSQTGNGSVSAAPVWKTPTQMRTDLGLATNSDVVYNSINVLTGGIRTPSCNYRKKTDQSINTSTFTAITFANGPSASYGEWDNNNWHPSSNSSFTTPSFSTGCLNVCGNVCFDQNGTGSRQVAIYDSGTGQYRYVIVPACTDNYTIVPFSWNIRCASSSNTITLYAWQNSGGALNIKGAATEGYTIISIAVCSATN